MKYSLIGIDGNAFSVMGYVRICKKKENKSQEEIKKYNDKAMLGDYNNLLCVSNGIINELNGE